MDELDDVNKMHQMGTFRNNRGSDDDLSENKRDESMIEKGISPELLALWDEVEKDKRAQKSDTKVLPRTNTQFNDNLWSKQWYMVCSNISII